MLNCTAPVRNPSALYGCPCSTLGYGLFSWPIFSTKLSVLKFQKYFSYCHVICVSCLLTIQQKLQIIGLFGTELMLAAHFLDQDHICNPRMF